MKLRDEIDLVEEKLDQDPWHEFYADYIRNNEHRIRPDSRASDRADLSEECKEIWEKSDKGKATLLLSQRHKDLRDELRRVERLNWDVASAHQDNIANWNYDIPESEYSPQNLAKGRS